VSHALVVGAGLAGLAAAHRLQSLGQRVTVLEARARTGGKHARESLSGVTYEPWPGWLPRSAPALAELCAELGLGAKLPREPLPLSTRAALGRSVFAPFRLRRYALLVHWLGGAIDPSDPRRETRLDDRSAADFCQVYLGRRARDELVAPLLAGAFGLRAEEASRELWFALLDAAGDPALDRLSGAGLLADSLASGLADVRTGVRVESVDTDRGGVRLAGGESLRADAVLLAVDAREAARLLGKLDPRQDTAFEALRAESALALAAVTREDLEPGERWLPARDGGELASLSIRQPRLVQLVARPGLDERHGRRPDAELAHLLLEAAGRVLPGLRESVSDSRLHRFPLGRPAFAVGHYRALATLDVPCAGDWRVAPHVEGELASGLSAARRLARAISQ
jgi:oxygen-dependent protoporphyrinogen oxidase